MTWRRPSPARRASHDLNLLAGLLPALALQRFVMSGELPGTAFASRVMDEVVYPLAGAPAAGTSNSQDATAGGEPHE